MDRRGGEGGMSADGKDVEVVVAHFENRWLVLNSKPGISRLLRSRRSAFLCSSLPLCVGSKFALLSIKKAANSYALVDMLSLALLIYPH